MHGSKELEDLAHAIRASSSKARNIANSDPGNNGAKFHWLAHRLEEFAAEIEEAAACESDPRTLTHFGRRNEVRPLYRLLYQSTSTIDWKNKSILSEIYDIVHVAVENNRKIGVTGNLIYSNGKFFQVLEGEENTIATLFDSIKLDKRHRNVAIMQFAPIENRLFTDWSMGCATRNIKTEQSFSPYLIDGRFAPDMMRPADAIGLTKRLWEIRQFTAMGIQNSHQPPT